MEELEKLREELGQLAEEFAKSPFMEQLSIEKQEHADFIADNLFSCKLGKNSDVIAWLTSTRV
ncbi:MAG: hypothetical protein AB8G86_11540 [Saprospiraceae bacterium]